MHYLKNIFLTIGTISFIGFLVLAFSSQPVLENGFDSLENDYNVYALEIPKFLDFSGEELPVYTQIFANVWIVSCS